MTAPVFTVLSARPAGAAALPPPAGWPLLRLGFRPFYLLAAAFGALAVPLWVAVLLGALDTTTVTATLPPLWWHAHEMLFGFASAVIVGFLLTAGKAWTGLPTPRGAALGALALLWVAARVAAVVASPWVFAALDLALLPLVALLLTRLLLRAGNRRNLPLAGLLLALSAANAVFHLAAQGAIGASPLAALHAGLAVIVMVLCVMAGRVVPAFTASATPGLALAAQPRLGPAALATTAAGLAAWVAGTAGLIAPGWAAPLLGSAALLHAWRLWGWQPAVARGRPVLWILHVSYAWIPVGLALLALATASVVGHSAGVHALAVGAMGGLIIGMLTRTARGHTGRPLQVSRAEVLAYALVMGAALLRSLVPLLVADPRGPLLVAAFAWSLAFLIYLRTFSPWLLQTRLDGKDG